MYLSRLLLNSRSPEVRRDFRNVHDLHRRVLQAFPDRGLEQQARKEFAALFRSETTPSGAVSLLIQSDTSPDWSRLPHGYLEECFEPNPACTNLDALIARIEKGTELRFRLRANATRCVPSDKGARGKRVEVVGIDRLIGWLNRKASGAGFGLAVRDECAAHESAQFAVRVTEEGKVRGFRAGAALTFGSVLFDGRLMVTDKDQFLASLRNGIGTAKAYGFGLLSVAPS